ncbi:hydrolase [Leucobacter massiliensis]|uniref:Hydrolase n=1 Tax=Leucobacter massiliensis TaxID=1686285 RepID=A0A2S9QSB8_9MICO|nr:hydrolase [Leucobacter massiliensis]
MIAPGVVDRHVHLGLVAAPELRGGPVVEVHDLGWDPVAIRRIATELGRGPRATRVRYAGPFHSAPGGYPSGRAWAPTGAVRGIASPADAEAAVQEARASGSSAIKITLHADFPQLSDEALAALIAAARAAGLPALAHAEGAGQAQRAIAAGVDVLVHVPWTERLPDALLEDAAERGVEWISTLAIHSGAELDRALGNAARYAAIGGRIAYGTDLGNGPAPPGVNEREIELLGQIGLDGARLREAVMPATAPAGLIAAPGPLPHTAAELVAWLAFAERCDEAAAAPPGARQ